MSKSNHPSRKEHGQSMIELALTITILMVLLAGTIDLGHAFFVWLAMRDAAQEGATYGSYDPAITEGNIEAYIIALAKTDAITDPAANVVAEVDFYGDRCLGYHADPNSLNKPNTIEVTVDYTNFPISMPFLGAIIGDTISIHATINDSIIAPMCP
jgi:Flp pilus assembly protein TadG